MSEIAIKFENISKQYRLGTIGTGTLSHDLNRWWIVKIRGKDDPYLKVESVNDRSIKADSEYVWALRNIDLEVKQGEVLGIIGRNGAGKSTLLKILSRVTSPTTGTIKSRGRIASLLEVGTGFHTEMTGRENIFMNGSIMGMTKAEIRRKFDEIVDFAEVERYIDTPVKRYSSGMIVRLGFAIAAHLEPEILVVDEVLAVGDAEFQKKAIGKMQDVSRNYGRTVLFVSHNMGAIKELCTEGVLINNGLIHYQGSIESTINLYLNKDENLNKINNEMILKKFGIQIIGIQKEQNGHHTNSVFFNEGFSITIQFKNIISNNLHSDVVIQITNEIGQVITSINSAEEGFKANNYNGYFKIILETQFMRLYPGKYYINLMFVSSVVSEIIEQIDTFEILPKQLKNSGWNYNSHHGIARIFEEFNIIHD
ncbi:MAG: ABC transporter ATP-binding protein [Lentimicrobiaceae bacterium]|jgi:lipopolysaccharide transport system ATP-binding protein